MLYVFKVCFSYKTNISFYGIVLRALQTNSVVISYTGKDSSRNFTQLLRKLGYVPNFAQKLNKVSQTIFLLAIL